MVAAPGAALAAAPAIQAPAADITVTEGATISYEWAGELQGSPDARERAYFVVEVIGAAKMPAGQQAPWPDADTARPTVPGQAATSLQLGAPPAGAWRWRVCAWGVVDPNIANELVQIPDGCSPSRVLTSKVALSQGGEVGVIAEERKVAVRGEQTIITKTRPAPAPVEEEPVVEPSPEPVVEEVVPEPVRIQPRTKGAKRSSSSALGLDTAATDLERTAGRDQQDLASNVLDGLNATLPGIPIPFWTLGFLLAALPIAVLWRRSVLGMFEWSDGSIDGFGTPQTDGGPVLATVQHAQDAQGSASATDVAGTGGASTSEPSQHVAA